MYHGHNYCFEYGSLRSTNNQYEIGSLLLNPLLCSTPCSLQYIYALGTTSFVFVSVRCVILTEYLGVRVNYVIRGESFFLFSYLVPGSTENFEGSLEYLFFVLIRWVI